MAKNVVVIGAQWGDEGKGKVVDWLTLSARGVVRLSSCGTWMVSIWISRT